MSLSGGSPVDRLDTDQEGRIYRQLKGRIEDLEDRLRSKIDGSKAEVAAVLPAALMLAWRFSDECALAAGLPNFSQERDLPIARCLQDLLEAQRDVSAALGKLLQSQSQLQERQAKAEEKQELQEVKGRALLTHGEVPAKQRGAPDAELNREFIRKAARPISAITPRAPAGEGNWTL